MGDFSCGRSLKVFASLYFLPDTVLSAVQREENYRLKTINLEKRKNAYEHEQTFARFNSISSHRRCDR